MCKKRPGTLTVVNALRNSSFLDGVWRLVSLSSADQSTACDLSTAWSLRTHAQWRSEGRRDGRSPGAAPVKRAAHWGVKKFCLYHSVCKKRNKKAQKLFPLIFLVCHQGRSDGGRVYRDIYLPQISLPYFLCGCFVSLQWLVNIYTPPPNQIPGYASVTAKNIIIFIQSV